MVIFQDSFNIMNFKICNLSIWVCRIFFGWGHYLDFKWTNVLNPSELE
jgi:hypothetical protein